MSGIGEIAQWRSTLCEALGSIFNNNNKNKNLTDVQRVEQRETDFI